MEQSRRNFLKLGAGAIAVSAFGGLGFSLAPVQAHAAQAKLQWTRQTTSICCYCAVGCGLIVSTGDKAQDPKTPGRAVNVEGDPDHPINEGALCAKGASIWQLTENDQRPKKPLYRAPNSTEWKEVSWDWALGEIAARVKKTRDASFMKKNATGETVNRTEAIASFGSAALDNEECWALQSMMRSLGLVYIEHQARL
jgi:formate dehydrogenase major subunit